MRIGNKIRKRLRGEIPRAEPGVKIDKPEVHGVGARVYSGMEAFDASRGGEQFRFFN
jgi:hypothetical protein